MTQINFSGNLAFDPELRYTPSGTAVTNIRVMVNNRKKNQQSGEWEDGTPTAWNVTAWKQLAENLAASATKGTRVVVTGRVEAREWTTQEGETRYAQDVQASDIGVSLYRGEVTVNKADRAKASDQPPQQDPWSTPAPSDEAVPF